MSFLVDCGKMVDIPENPYPRLTTGMIKTIDAVFLTHSHADHTGALPWLFENGFDGTVIAADETLRQLPFDVKNSAALNEICPTGSGHFRNLSIGWGRSGHCVGSLWYRFSENQKTIFLSGDYTDDTLVYAFDPIMGMTADLAVLDCAYGHDKIKRATSWYAGPESCWCFMEQFVRDKQTESSSSAIRSFTQSKLKTPPNSS